MRIDWDKVSRNLEPLGSMLCGSVCTLIVITTVILACAGPGGRQGTIDGNEVSARADVSSVATADIDARATVEAPITLDANANLRADMAVMKTEIGEIRAALIGPVTIGPVGGNHAQTSVGGDQHTVDSLTSQVLAKYLGSTLKWSVLISLATVAVYVLCHRFRSTRRVLDWCKGHGEKAEIGKQKAETHGAQPVGIEHCRHGSGTGPLAHTRGSDPCAECGNEATQGKS